MVATVALLAAACLASTTTAAAAAAGCRATYTVTSSWPGGFGATVDITNLGDPINGWTLTWSYSAGQTITQLWNGTYTQSGAQVAVKNVDYNATLATAATTTVGFNGAFTTGNPPPTNLAVNGVLCTGATASPSAGPSSTASPSSSPSPSGGASPSTSPSASPSTSTSPTAGPWPPSSTFGNPVLWEDLADADVFRVGDTYYYTASTMHYSPGAPILRSYDLVHWEYAGHAVPNLDFGSSAYNLSGGRAYVKGIWASAMNYRRSNGTYYWIGCVEFNRTYVYTATAVDGTWQKRAQINNCYYDAGLLVDDNDTMYVAYGNTTINVAQLSADGLSQVRSQAVFTSPSSVGTIEGSRFYKRNGAYYILVTRPANAEYVLKSTSGPFGPYTMQPLLNNIGSPIAGGGVPHQGGLVQTAAGDWYYMAFVDSYPGGRVPVLAPVTWSADGWPQLQTVNGAWGSAYAYPNVPRPPREVRGPTGVDTFASAALGPEWEWNHNPDNTKWSAGGGLTLQAATVTSDLYAARNTLTHRILGPTSTATIQLDYSAMKDGDRAGLAMLRDQSAWIGIKRDNGSTRLVLQNNITMDGNWNTTNTGSEAAGQNVAGGRIWLRVSADIHPGSGRLARFSYSTDGVTFTSFGPSFAMNNAWQFFMGYRFAIFDYATQSLGGSVKVASFALTTP
ncbi:family 43 glycosylhydrolase [Hamadaea tsunoensis]|uniref:family 43 glycosylhydrolase n=1 Tax=Hamadaea tsunoensis TaxID=53368 RepID=UPI0003F5FF70